MANDMNDVALTDATLVSNEVRCYEYGVRLDPECVPVVEEQLWAAHRLYNDIVAAMRKIYDEAQAWTLERAGDEGRRAYAAVQTANASFDAARAVNDEAGMRACAAHRRELWRDLSASLGAVRKAHAKELRERFWNQIGTGSQCVTYALRCQAVAAGLGWATANDVLARALLAWKGTMKQGRPPRFSKASERSQDCLTLQFTAAGGVDVRRLLDGSHAEFAIAAPDTAGRRKYGSFRFRLGAAAADKAATGTLQLHRAMPPASASSVRLVRRRVANKFKWAVQVVLRLATPVLRTDARASNTLAAVHFGWAADVAGRRVAGITNGPDPGLARLLQLPVTIEEDLERAAEIQSERDKARDAAAGKLKDLVKLPLPDKADAGLRERFSTEVGSLKTLRIEHIAARRFYVIGAILRRMNVQVDWLSDWIAEDRKRWQATVGIARRARARRRDFYRQEALQLARCHSAIVVEPLDLKAAAQKIDEATGERSEFGRKARAGRTVAALYEFEQELRKAAADYGRAVFELSAQPTATTCPHCGSQGVAPLPESHQDLACPSCGAITDRKRSGAAMAWQISAPGIEDRIVKFHLAQRAAAELARSAAADRKARMAQGRQAARGARTSGHGQYAAGEQA